MTSLFMTKQQDSTMLDIGKHCYKCQKLDFLPFSCEFCGHIYCEGHRSLQSHGCEDKRPQRQIVKDGKHVDSKESVASLFPNRIDDMKKVDQSLQNATLQPTNIITKQFRVGDVAKRTTNAFTKFARYLNVKTDQGKGVKKPIVSKTADIMTLRKNAKGDIKVATNDRIYLWCKAVDDTKSLVVPTSEERGHAVYISKNWPAGRALDSIADTLRIKNNNNSTVSNDERLNMFLMTNGVSTVVANSERCNVKFKTGDTVYLVRGTLE